MAGKWMNQNDALNNLTFRFQITIEKLGCERKSTNEKATSAC